MKARHKKVISKYEFEMLKRDHVVGVGYGGKRKNGRHTGEDAIVILVDEKVPSEKLKNRDIVPMKMGDFQTDVVEVGKLEFFDLRTERMRPARPGVSIGHYKITAGTLGAIVKDKNTGEPLILSNNHVLANITNGHDGRSEKGDPILQPGAYDNGEKPGDVIGHLDRFIPINKGGGDQPTCPIALSFERLVNGFLHLLRPDYNFKLLKQGSENIVDCAVAKPVDNKEVDSKIVDIGRVQGITAPEEGMNIQKSGRTTGVTKGKINVVNSTVQIQMTQNDVAVFKDQIITDPISKPGDSGSLVLDDKNNAVGLLFAGSDKATVCNNISNVLEELEVEF